MVRFIRNLTDADGLSLDDVLAVDAGKNVDGPGGESLAEEDQVEDGVDDQLEVVQNHQSDLKHEPGAYRSYNTYRVSIFLLEH